MSVSVSESSSPVSHQQIVEQLAADGRAYAIYVGQLGSIIRTGRLQFLCAPSGELIGVRGPMLLARWILKRWRLL